MSPIILEKMPVPNLDMNVILGAPRLEYYKHDEINVNMAEIFLKWTSHLEMPGFIPEALQIRSPPPFVMNLPIFFEEQLFNNVNEDDDVLPDNINVSEEEELELSRDTGDEDAEYDSDYDYESFDYDDHDSDEFDF